MWLVDGANNSWRVLSLHCHFNVPWLERRPIKRGTYSVSKAGIDHDHEVQWTWTGYGIGAAQIVCIIHTVSRMGRQEKRDFQRRSPSDWG